MNRLMPITEDSGYFPPVGGLVPNDQEFGLAKTLAGFNPAERVMPFFDGSISLDRENLQASRGKHASEIAAYVLMSFLDVVLPRPCDATFVMVELDVLIQITGMLFKLIGRAAVIECIEEFSIKF